MLYVVARLKLVECTVSCVSIAVNRPFRTGHLRISDYNFRAIDNNFYDCEVFLLPFFSLVLKIIQSRQLRRSSTKLARFPQSYILLWLGRFCHAAGIGFYGVCALGDMRSSSLRLVIGPSSVQSEKLVRHSA